MAPRYDSVNSGRILAACVHMARSTVCPSTAGAAIAALTALLSGCGHQTATAPGNTTVRIDTILPSALVQSDVAQTITINGTGFVFTAVGFETLVVTPSGTTITYRAPDIHILRPTTFELSLTASESGAYRFFVENSPTDVSAESTLTASPSVSASKPVLISVTPAVAMRDSGHAQIVTFAGTGFLAGSIVRVADPDNFAADRADIILGTGDPL